MRIYDKPISSASSSLLQGMQKVQASHTFPTLLDNKPTFAVAHRRAETLALYLTFWGDRPGRINGHATVPLTLPSQGLQRQFIQYYLGG